MHLILKKPGRVCNACGKWRPSSKFGTNGFRPNGKPRLRSVCRDCGRIAPLPPEKRCPRCGVVKPIDEFHVKALVYCRSCLNERTYAYRRGPGRKEHNRRMCEYQKRKYHSDPVYREKAKARSSVSHAVRLGVLRKPDKCSACGSKRKLSAHHHNGYKLEHHLDVQWVCFPCHRRLDFGD